MSIGSSVAIWTLSNLKTINVSFRAYLFINNKSVYMFILTNKLSVKKKISNELFSIQFMDDDNMFCKTCDNFQFENNKARMKWDTTPRRPFRKAFSVAIRWDKWSENDVLNCWQWPTHKVGLPFLKMLFTIIIINRVNRYDAKYLHIIWSSSLK